MSHQTVRVAVWLGTCLIGAGCAAFVWADAPPGSTTASKVTNPVTEVALTQVTLRPDAETRLGIQVQPAARGTMQERRLFPGHAMAAMGNDVTLTSPIIGIVRIPAEVGNLRSPWTCDRGVQLLAIMPTASDGGMITLSSADGEAKLAAIELEASRVRLKRAEVLRQNNASAQKALDDAIAEFQKAEVRAASTQLNLESVRSSLGGFEKGPLPGVVMMAPVKGVVGELHVSDGQVVTVGAPLLRITQAEPLWVRVSVPAGELALVDEKAAASIGELGVMDIAKRIKAERIFGPRTTNGVSGAVDLYYEFANERNFLPGQRLAASLPTKRQMEGVIIPSSCIVTDMHGGDWVYQRIADQTYARRRVEVTNAEESKVLVKGLALDSSIVVIGAAELFGIEFGAGK
ncbi:MAG: HlyD family efflux transporter periplasmic adaptor subunit [Planctomycetota bacterium]